MKKIANKPVDNKLKSFKEDIIKAENIAEGGNYESAYFHLLKTTLRYVGISQGQINVEIVNRECDDILGIKH